ncbi:hypothetical protein BJ742DRAFT_770359 [Cladochytrium replicatum]|nr:hypothetical protein BJ742DRAFT_770359 [Cladochytrium replicatum]
MATDITFYPDVRNVVPETAIWEDYRGYTSDFDRMIYAHKNGMPFRQGAARSTYTIFPSKKHGFYGKAAYSMESGEIEVEVFECLERSTALSWSSRQVIPVVQLPDYETDRRGYLDGWITSDGTHVVVRLQRGYGDNSTWIATSKDGWKSCKFPGSPLLDNVIQSDDGEYIFSEVRKNHGGSQQHAEVQARSLRTMKVVKTWTFKFGDSVYRRHMSLISPSINGRLHAIIETKGFDVDRNSPALIVSSDGAVHFNAAGVSCEDQYIWISPNQKYMIRLNYKDGELQCWDLERPTLKPLVTTHPVPSVEFSKAYPVYLLGQLTQIRDSVSKQVFSGMFSESGAVFTLVGSGINTVLFQASFLVFNLQLVDCRDIHVDLPRSFVPMSVALAENKRPSVIGGIISVVTLAGDPAGMDVVYMKATQFGLDIDVIFDYFERWSASISAVRTIAESKSEPPFAQFKFRRDTSLKLDLMPSIGGALTSPPRDSMAWKHQNLLFKRTLSKGRFPDTQAFRDQRLPYLLTCNIPWCLPQLESESSTSIFAAVLEYDFVILAVSSSTTLDIEASVVRVLYESHNSNISSIENIIEFYRHGRHVLLSIRIQKRAYDRDRSEVVYTTVADGFFCQPSAGFDVVIAANSLHTTLPGGGWGVNIPVLWSNSFAAYFRPEFFDPNDHVLTMGNRSAPDYNIAKFEIWRNYTLHESRNEFNDIILGGTELRKQIGETFSMIYDDPAYDDSRPVFGSTFLAAINHDLMVGGTRCVDAFLKKMHQSDALIIGNGASISSAFPLLLRARPWEAVRLMRKLTHLDVGVADIGRVTSKTGKSFTDLMLRPLRATLGILRGTGISYFFSDLFYLLFGIFRIRRTFKPGSTNSNAKKYTLPLPNFCSYNLRLYRGLTFAGSRLEEVGADFSNAERQWRELQLEASGNFVEVFFRSWDLARLSKTARRISPFVRVVEELSQVPNSGDGWGDDSEMIQQLLNVPWFQKLIQWKLQKFGIWTFLIRGFLPMLAMFGLHVTTSVLLTSTETTGASGNNIPQLIKILVSVEVALAVFLLGIKLRSFIQSPRLIISNFYTFLDVTAIGLAVAMFIQIVLDQVPPRAFLAFSVPVLWIDVVLMLRIFQNVGTLVLLVTEMVKRVSGFLALMGSLIFGFAFIPFLLLRNVGSESSVDSSSDPNPFDYFHLTLFEMLRFVGNDFDSLSAFRTIDFRANASSGDSYLAASVRGLQSLFVLMVSILLLNLLIALLNMAVAGAAARARNIWHYQMAVHICEIELGYLLPHERRRTDWFPPYFSYTMTEMESRLWQEFVDKNPLVFAGDDEKPAKVATEAEPAQRAAPQTTTGAAQPTTTQVDDNGSDIDDQGDDLAAPATATSATSVKTTMENTASNNTATTANVTTSASTTVPSSLPMITTPSTGTDQTSTNNTTTTSAAGTLPSTSTANSRGSTKNPEIKLTAPPRKDLTVPRLPPSSSNENTSPPSPQPPPMELIPTGDTERSTTNTDAAPLCTICSKPGRYCTRCRKVAYCSVEHQKADWKAGHKEVCRPSKGG